MNGAGRFIILALVVASWAPAVAQDQGAQQGQSPTPAKGKDAQAKSPPPPLFPHHHRGMYRNAQGIEVVDATPQSPPLETDDPGVPDKGEYEINLTTLADLSKDAERFDLLFVDANYGVLPTIAGRELPTQIKFEVPVAATSEDGSPYRLGLGTAAFGLKFNFHRNENTGLSMAVYPQVEFAPPGTDAVKKGLAEPGEAVLLPFLVAKELRFLTAVANAAVEIPVQNPDGGVTGVYGFGLGRALTTEIAAMMEVRAESSFDLRRDRLVFLNAGLIRGVGDFVVYARLGRSIFSDDGLSHTYLGGGIKLLLQPPGTKQVQ